MPNKINKGFTLIELLVVISIIALLLGILMPGLQMAKKKAQALVCKTNLKQWGLAVSLYAQGNEDKFMSTAGGLWVEPLKPYLGGGHGSVAKVLLCPKTKADHSDPFFRAWSTPLGGEDGKDLVSSYGINNWVYDFDGSTAWGNDTRHAWRKMSNISASFNTPIFMGNWRWGGMPTGGQNPMTERPETMEQLQSWSLGTNEINRFNLDRHEGRNHVVYVDGSVESVTLRDIWALKWHKDYNGGEEYARVEAAGWPEWMKR